jgi:hypothetical protein
VSCDEQQRDCLRDQGGQVFVPFSTTSASIVLSLPLYPLRLTYLSYSIVAKAFLINQASWTKRGKVIRLRYEVLGPTEK